MKHVGHAGVFLLALLAPSAAAQSALAALETAPGGPVVFQTVEELQVADRDKIKLLPATSGNVTPADVQKLKAVDLRQAGVLRGDGNGRVMKESGDGTARAVVLPERFELRTPSPAASVPGRLPLRLLKTKKDKVGQTIPPESLFLYAPGPAAERNVADLLMQEGVFSPADRLRAIDGFVGSLPNSAVLPDLRRYLEAGLEQALARIEDRGAFADLQQAAKFGEMGRRRFAAAAALRTSQERVTERIRFIEARVDLLQRLARARAWDSFLTQYAAFERYQWSFPAIMELRTAALEESARAHALRARDYALREDHDSASREAAAALQIDPANRDTTRLLETAKVRASQAESRRLAASPTTLVKDSPEDRRYQRALFSAERAIEDKDYARADQETAEAARENPDGPEIVLMRAKLLIAQKRYAEALPVLDRYDRLVAAPELRELGEAQRNAALYELGRIRKKVLEDVAALETAGRYSELDQVLQAALTNDGADPDYLFHGGLAAAIVNQPARARTLLTTYRERSNFLGSDLRRRDTAERVLALLPPGDGAQPRASTVDWMSARPRPAAVLYSPVSLAFQLLVASVTGGGVTMNYRWENGRLQSISSAFDEKGLRFYRQLMRNGNQATPVEQLTDPLPGAFQFTYWPDGPLRRVTLGATAPATVPPFRLMLSGSAKQRRVLAADDQPEIVLPGHPSVDLTVAEKLAGAKVATVVAGNAFFHPFVWDGLHYFTLEYDEAGRAVIAREWDQDNLLRFSWDGDLLTEIQGFHGASLTPYYKRTISYAAGTGAAASRILREAVVLNGRNEEIRYNYTRELSLRDIEFSFGGEDWTARPRN